MLFVLGRHCCVCQVFVLFVPGDVLQVKIVDVVAPGGGC